MLQKNAVVDPGFPVGGCAPIGGGRGPPTQVLFSENVCKNERIGSHGGWRVPDTPPRSANGMDPSLPTVIHVREIKTNNFLGNFFFRSLRRQNLINLVQLFVDISVPDQFFTET